MHDKKDDRKRKSEQHEPTWERVSENVSRLPVAEGHLWKVHDETFFLPTVAYLERIVEAARKVESALLNGVTKH